MNTDPPDGFGRVSGHWGSRVDAVGPPVEALRHPVPTAAGLEVRLGGAGDALVDEVAGELFVED